MFKNEDLKEQVTILEEESVYEEAGRLNLLKSDAINAEEEGFMQGYEREETVICSVCKHPLTNSQESFEKAVDNKLFRFCSKHCLEEFDNE